MSELLTVGDVVLMQGLAQRVWALRPDLVNVDASFGELAWIWGKDHQALGGTWRRRLWLADGTGRDLVAWAWAHLPHQFPRSDGSVKDVTHAAVAYQVHPAHAELLDEVIAWFDGVAPGVERRVITQEADKDALDRWAASGYEPDPADEWTRLNERTVQDIAAPVLADGFRFRTAAQVEPKLVAQAHIDAWHPTKYSLQAYEGVRVSPGYRPDLHLLVEAPDGTMAASTIMWLDEVNRNVEFEPVGAHPGFRRLGLSQAMLLHGLQVARDAGAVHATVASDGTPGNAALRLYEGAGFRYVNRDITLVKRTPGS